MWAFLPCVTLCSACRWRHLTPVGIFPPSSQLSNSVVNLVPAATRPDSMAVFRKCPRVQTEKQTRKTGICAKWILKFVSPLPFLEPTIARSKFREDRWMVSDTLGGSTLNPFPLGGTFCRRWTHRISWEGISNPEITYLLREKKSLTR